MSSGVAMQGASLPETDMNFAPRSGSFCIASRHFATAISMPASEAGFRGAALPAFLRETFGFAGRVLLFADAVFFVFAMMITVSLL
jgi:hypothetical protein